MTIFTKVSAAALAAALSTGAAFASVNPTASLDTGFAPIEANIAPDLALTADADLDAFIKDLKSRRDDGTLNERDFQQIRKFRQTAAVTLDDFVKDLKSRRDDGTLNERDFQDIRRFERNLA